MTRENQVREKIDRQLLPCGWILQNFAAMNITAGPGVAVTVDRIATGIDVKQLECQLSMRNINSWAYFEQMKGRGSRVVNPDQQRSVTPDARHKIRFVIVDAVRVCENDKSASKPLDRKPSVPMKKLLQQVSMGTVRPDITSSLAARLTRIAARRKQSWHDDFERAAGYSIADVAKGLMNSTDNDQPAAVFYPSPTDSNIPVGNTEQADQIAESEPALTPVQDSQLQQLEQQRMRDALQMKELACQSNRFMN